MKDWSAVLTICWHVPVQMLILMDQRLRMWSSFLEGCGFDKMSKLRFVKDGNYQIVFCNKLLLFNRKVINHQYYELNIIKNFVNNK